MHVHFSVCVAGFALMLALGLDTHPAPAESPVHLNLLHSVEQGIYSLKRWLGKASVPLQNLPTTVSKLAMHKSLG